MSLIYDIDKNGLSCVKFNSAKHIDLTYYLLVKRQHFISYRKNISKANHKKFCLSHPYRFWYIIFKFDEPIGTFYLTKQNAVGININTDDLLIQKKVIKFILRKFHPLKPIPSVTPEYFYFNVPMTNKNLMDDIEKIGGEKIQITFKV